ncbi:metallophosphoesterase family protein, partial [Lishizhenia sp.]|uniref:purple acid phosphatase family protein n=1 Tax=Lishizhenia sp. TaxID=2497594 RepID=UPI00299EED28
MKNILVIFSALFSFISLAEVRFVRVMFYGDASTSATIGWDQLNVDAHTFFYDTLPIDPNNPKNCIDRFIVRKDKGMNNHFVELTNLQPNTRYYFSIQDKNGFSAPYYFYTVPNTPNTPLAFVAGGDSRTRSAVRRQANLLVAKLKPHAVLFDGDYTAIDTHNEWLEWFEDWTLTVGKDGRITPIVPSRGNHERTNKVMVNIFNVPSKRVYYSTQFGGGLVNIVVLNSEIWKGGAQTWYLKNNLEKHKDYTWSIPMYHRPMRPHVKHKKEMQTQYKHFVPVFEAYKNVRLAIECDSHTCKSTWPILKCKDDENCDEGFVRNDSLGIVY